MAFAICNGKHKKEKAEEHCSSAVVVVALRYSCGGVVPGVLLLGFVLFGLVVFEAPGEVVVVPVAPGVVVLVPFVGDVLYGGVELGTPLFVVLEAPLFIVELLVPVVDVEFGVDVVEAFGVAVEAPGVAVDVF